MIDNAMPARMPGPVPLPRRWSVGAAEIVAVLVANGVLILGMWLRHGGLDQLSTLDGQLTAIGQLTALFGTYLALVQLVLMSRSPWLDQVFGMDGLAVAHRWLGFATVWLLLGHGLFTTVGYALSDRTGVVDEFVTLITTYPYVLMALVSGGPVRRRGDQLDARRASPAVVRDVVRHPSVRLPGDRARLPPPAVRRHRLHARPARGRLLGAAVRRHDRAHPGLPRRPARRGCPCAIGCASSRIVHEGPDVVSIYMTGRDLDQLAVRSGQYFVWRFLTRDGWWRGHPFSISSAPNGSWLRITIKELGDWSGSLARVPVGTRVFVEGPYGVLTGARRTRPKVLLVAGGIGITPLRALLEALPARPGDLTLAVPRRRRDPDRLPRRARDARPRSRRDGPLSRRLAPAGGSRPARRGRSRAARARMSATATSTSAVRSR